MKPFSPEWQAREDEWNNLLDRNYEAAANQLVADGYTRKAHDYFPAVFTKDNQTVILVRQLGSSRWYVIVYEP